jgi:hypothetical protein
MGGDGILRALCVALIVVNCASATTFSAQNLAPNTTGGQRYEAEMGETWTLQMLQDVRSFIVEALSLSYRDPDHVTFIVEDFDGAAYNSNNEIHVAAKLLESTTGDLRFEIQGLMYHELCHSFQNNKGNYGTDPHFTGVLEGIATYMELAAGYGVGPKVKGGNWFDGYHTTAHFFAWIDVTYLNQFVNLLNQRMGLQDWTDVFFVNLTGKDVDTLWSEYQNSF